MITAFEINAHRIEDTELLDQATTLERVLFSQDRDLLLIAAHRQRQNLFFSGIVYAHQHSISVGQCIDDLELIAKVNDLSDHVNRVEYLPL